MKLTKTILMATAALYSSVSAATVTVNNGAQGTFSIVSSDSPGTGATVTGTASIFGSGALTELNDNNIYGGQAISSTNHSYNAATGATVDFDLGLGANGLGWDINTITSLTGHQSRAGQNYSVEYSVVGSATFTALASTDSGHVDPEKQVVISDINLSGVDVIRFTFGQGGGLNNVYREIDIQGVSTVPEPSTTALLGLGGIALLLRRRK